MRCSSLCRYAAAVLLVCCAYVAGGSHRAQACMLDQKPSMSADGRLADTNTRTPASTAELAAWTYYYFPHSYARGHVVVLREDRRAVGRVLSAEAMRQPWVWQFGDGRIAYGSTVRHAYVHAGHWRIRVYAWDPESGRWDIFDQATIAIT